MLNPSSWSERADTSLSYTGTPQVNDIYAAQCSKLFSYRTSEANPYCLIRVVNVAQSKVIFVSADTMFNSKETALDKLSSNLIYADVVWDMNTKFEVNRAKLDTLGDTGVILMVRRLSGSEVNNYITSISANPL